MKSDTTGTLVVTGNDLNAVVTRVGVDRLMDELIGSLTERLGRHDDAQTRLIKRDGFMYDYPHPGVLEWMPAMVVGQQAVVKVVGYNPSNPGQRNLPTIVSTINVFDVTTGRLVALIDGILPTALRTGAASAVATEILARSGRCTVGLVGCGAQAVTQLHGMSRVRDVQQALVYDIDPAASASFADRVEFMDISVEVVERSVLERESDIICTATSADIGAGPVVDDAAFKPWIHVNAVGSDLPGKIELPVDFLRRSLVCTDFLEQALAEGEAQQLEPSDLGPTLSQLVKEAGDHVAARERPTVFDSTGYAVEDLVAAELFLRYATEMGLGQTLMVERLQGDPRNPYANLILGKIPAGVAE